MKQTDIQLKECPVDFDPKNHTYILKSNGKMVPGVTNISGSMDKPFLVWWAAKEAVKDLGFYDPKQITNEAAALKRAEEIRKEIAAMDTPTYIKRLAEAKGAHTRRSKQALVSGKIAHTAIEDYIAGNEPNLEGDEKAIAAFNAFLDWEKQNEVEWLHSELIVGSEVHEYGGMLDGIAHVNDILTLVDFKTSSVIGEEYFLQTAAYSLALEEMGMKVDRRIILRIPKDGSEFESMVVPTDEKFDREAFLALREVQRWKSYINNPDNLIKDKQGKVIVSLKK